MPDRELTDQETLLFLTEAMQQKPLLNALEIVLNESTKPSLHDCCILELLASAEALRKIAIDQGREIENLKKRLG